MKKTVHIVITITCFLITRLGWADSISKHMINSYSDSLEYAKISEDICDNEDIKDPEVLFNLAETYWGDKEKRDEAKAHAYYIKAAEKGHPAANARLGTAYSVGNTLVKKDLKKRDYYFNKACDLGYKWACCYVAKNQKCNETDFKTKEEWVNYLFLNEYYKEAYKYLLKHKDIQKSKTEFYLGVFFEKGIIVKKDLDKAINHYQKSYQEGSARSAYQLGLIYLKKDKIKSQYYFEKSCDLGNKKGCKARYADVAYDFYN